MVGINIIFYYFILTYKEYCENIVAIYCVNIFLLLYKQVKQKILPTKKKSKKNREEEEEGKCNSGNFMIFSLQIIRSMLLRVGGQ